MNNEERTARFNNLIEVLRETETFYMPNMRHDCGTPACIAGHCEAHFGEELRCYLGISMLREEWLLYGDFSKKNWENITQDEAITALEMVRDNKVPNNPYNPKTFTID